MLATKETIIRYIPQRAPMVMIHNLLEADGDHAVTQLQVDPDNLFVQNGIFREPGLIENIAQTAAAHVGFLSTEKGMKIPVGFIAGIKNLEVFSLPPLDSMLTTVVRIINQVFDVTIIQGTIEQNGKILCSCEMKIYVKNE